MKQQNDKSLPALKTKLFSKRAEFYLTLAWEIILLGLYTIAIYCEAIFRIFYPIPLKPLNKEIILITGSGNGIGRETCIELANTGATLICWDIDGIANEKLVADIKFLGVKAYGYEIDVSDRFAVELMAKKVQKEIGNVTMIINNAGIMPCHEFLSHNPREIERSFQVNVFSHFWILREFLPSMIQKNKGHIVTVSSAAGLIPTRNLVPYCGSKHAVSGYIDALKDELKHHPKKPNIHFTTLYPCACKTKLIQHVQCNSRFPSILPIVEPDFVAKKLVEGIRRNYENVYVPSSVMVFATLSRCFLPKAQAAGSDFFQCNVEPLRIS